MNTSFPLVTLRPVSDARDAWAALLLDMTPADAGDALARLFGELGLAEALGPLPCIVAWPAAAGIDALPAAKVVLCLPAAIGSDPSQAAALQDLRARGFRLTTAGAPAAGRTPYQDVDGQFLWFAGKAAEVAKPAHAKGGHAPNELLLLELLSKVVNDADSHEIEETIKRDPELSYHLLRMVNSVAFSLTTKIASFNQAITLLGRRQLQRWLQLLMYAHGSGGDMANPLLPRGAMRASLMEALCAAKGGSHDAQDSAFMVGMFSLLDVLFGKPLAAIVKPLNLADDVLAALLERAGPLGVQLRLVEAGETAAPAEFAALLVEAGIGNEEWARCAIRAAQWAIQVSREA